MAFGTTPKFIQEVPLAGLSKSEAITLAVLAAQSLEWSVIHLSEAGIIAHTGSSVWKWNAEVTVKISDEMLSVKSASTGSELMDWGKNKKCVVQFLAAFEQQKTTAPEDLAATYEALRPHMAPPEADVLVLPPPTAGEKAKNFLSIFKPSEGYYITPILLDLNILVFIVMAACGVNVLEPSTDSLIKWGANFKPYTLDGQWWRLLTNCFLHIGIIHLGFNMYALLFIGVLLEPLLGKLRYLVAYLLTGICASIASLWWHDVSVSAGASGAIFGMYGVFLALLTTNIIEKRTRKTQLGSIGIFVAYNLLYGMTGNIDNSAHIGGLISGLIIGYAFIPSVKKEGAISLKAATVGLLSVAVIGLSAFALKTIPNNIGTYDKQMKAFSALEKSALQVYSLPDTASVDERVHAYRDEGLPDWRKAQEIVLSLEGLKLPDVYKKRTKQLRRYCELRIRGYELSAKILEENNEAYLPELDSTNKEIDKLFAEMEEKGK